MPFPSSRFLPGVAFLLAAACGQGAPTDGTPLPQPSAEDHVALEQGHAEIELGIGQAVRLGGKDLSIAFRGIGQDSRCPIDALCVWQGDAAAHLIVATSRGREVVTLHTALDPRSVHRAGLVVELVAVTPAPRSGRRIPAEAYRITLRVLEG